MDNLSYLEMGNRLLAADSIALFPHVHMDGDALGSASALCMALRAVGKKAYVLCHEDTPGYMDFLEYGCVTRDADILGDIDLAVMVDCSSLSRIKWREDIFCSARQKAVIDHHGVTEHDVEFDFGIIEADSAATGEIIYMLIEKMGWTIDLDIANALYAAISTDTGDYSYQNTTKRSHIITSNLHDVEGFDPKRVSSLLYGRTSLGALKLEGMMIESIHLYHGGKLAVGRVTDAMLKETGCDMSESEGFVQRILNIDGVEIACLLKDIEGRVVRVSLRAKSYANVANVAMKHGGGGHIRAAGCKFQEETSDIDEVEHILVEDIESEL